jgi:single-strand DNA-binding protein
MDGNSRRSRMMWMNVTCLVGRATAEPRQRQTAGGTPYVTLRIAVPRGRQQADYFTVELWGKLANAAQRLVVKGTIVSVRCELKQQAWVTDGQRRERTVILVRTLGVIRTSMTYDELAEGAAAIHDDDVIEFTDEDEVAA